MQRGSVEERCIMASIISSLGKQTIPLIMYLLKQEENRSLLSIDDLKLIFQEVEGPKPRDWVDDWVDWRNTRKTNNDEVVVATH